MTDPGFADRTYLEPLDLEGVAAVLERERPDALLPTLGGQTALNLALELAEAGVLDELGVELIGAPRRRDPPRRGPRALPRGRPELRAATCRARGSSPSVDDLARRRCPGGRPAGVHARRPRRRLRRHRRPSCARQVERGLRESPIGQVLVEESVRGWDEFELEVMRDRSDNVVIVCSIENLDPMGVHTGDSVTVAPQMTLSDEAYQELRDAAIAVIRAVGVETRRLEHPVRARPRHRRAARDRDEPARLALVRARLEGDGLPDREGRGEARGRLHARRDPERPDEDDAGELRADARLRRRQVPALRVREVPRRRPHARHADEVASARRWASAARSTEAFLQGAALARARRLATPGASSTHPVGPRGLERASPLDELLARRLPALKRAGWRTPSSRRGHEGGRAARTRRRAPVVPPRRLVRRRGRGRLELLLLDLGRGGRGAAGERQAARRHPRLGPEPDRPGDRVRLLLRPRRAELPRARLRGGDGQLQPGDGLDRLRHVRPPLLRAARRRGGARRLRARAAGRAS